MQYEPDSFEINITRQVFIQIFCFKILEIFFPSVE